MIRTPTMTAAGFDSLYAQLPDFSELDGLLQGNLHAHGDFEKWHRAVLNLPPVTGATVALGDTITVDGAPSTTDKQALRNSLQVLHPWRKGPFSLFGVPIDSEWRCDFKWQRIAPHIKLDGLRILDVGCGNGYYGWRMLGAGADLVVGIDATVLYGMQHRAISHCIGDDRNQVLPLALAALPEAYPRSASTRYSAWASSITAATLWIICGVLGGAWSPAVSRSSKASSSPGPKHWFPMAAMRACAMSGTFPHNAGWRTGWPHAAFRTFAS